MLGILENQNLKPYSARFQNLITFDDYYSQLRLLALSVYEWSGLPDSINARYLETTLFRFGQALFFNDKTMGFLALQCTPSSMLNVYWEPTEFTAISVNYSHMYTTDDSVFIRNNYDCVPTEKAIRLFAERLTTAERVTDINLKAQRTPLFVLCEEKQRMTIKNIFAQYEGNELLLIGDKSLNPDSMKAINTTAPYLLDKLDVYKENIWNRAMTFLGINNANTNKKERLITNEVSANDQLIATSAEVMLLARKEAAEKINKMFGLSVSVDLRQPPQQDMIEMQAESLGSEVNQE
jgi:hypothetical protein